MTATLQFPSRQIAQAFASTWSRHSLRGYSLSAARDDGTATVSLDGVTDAEAQWINSAVAALNSPPLWQECLQSVEDSGGAWKPFRSKKPTPATKTNP